MIRLIVSGVRWGRRPACLAWAGGTPAPPDRTNRTMNQTPAPLRMARKPTLRPVSFSADPPVKSEEAPRLRARAEVAMSPNEPSSPSTVADLAILGRLFEEHR